MAVRKAKGTRMKYMVDKKRLPENMLKVKIVGKTNEGVGTSRQFYVKPGTTVNELTQLAQLMLQLGAEVVIETITTVDTKAHLFSSAITSN
ncbi:hypothetical protein HMPREF0877_0539 [Weissella paramesenteroides ATCC 33313]|uniref:Uncharacterized protein n=2 Tax=Weissella paramesenteroides TaxID=1249 RepID=C5R994_WEIPA|nr:hypothetical protein HMPREF0877_0539 [Weissella paramesenteroides ATCC 33313]